MQAYKRLMELIEPAESEIKCIREKVDSIELGINSPTAGPTELYVKFCRYEIKELHNSLATFINLPCNLFRCHAELVLAKARKLQEQTTTPLSNDEETVLRRMFGAITWAAKEKEAYVRPLQRQFVPHHGWHVFISELEGALKRAMDIEADTKAKAA